jgi:hypothetical protein
VFVGEGFEVGGYGVAGAAPGCGYVVLVCEFGLERGRRNHVAWKSMT